MPGGRRNHRRADPDENQLCWKESFGRGVGTIPTNCAAGRFHLPGHWNDAVTGATRRPWDSRCKPGEQFYAGLCCDIPVGYEITVPGFIGEPCPSGWRDDGVQCYPIWTGPKVAYQADPDGSLPMQRRGGPGTARPGPAGLFLPYAAAGITPVPGGVGPLTVAMLIHNTVLAARLRRGSRTLPTS
jgi:hypothetical protein